MTERITISSPVHGERVFERVGSKPYTRKDGTEITLAVWRGTCMVCGGPFELATPEGATSKETRFGVVACPQHRLTPSDVASLRASKADKRLAKFEAIKAAKLGANGQVSSPPQ